MKQKNSDGQIGKALLKSAKSLIRTIPIIFSTIFLVSLANTLLPKSFYLKFLGQNNFFSSIIGSVIGSVSAGSPLTSYVIGGEMLQQGVSLAAVTAFLVAWVTVGMIQLPAESMILGKKFAILRNVSAFFLSLIVAFITVLLFELL